MAHLKQNIKQIKLYDYQQIAFDKIVVALKKTFRALMVMSTGLGKTIMSIEVVKYFITPKDKVLFLCHDNGILNKTYKDYKKFIGDSYTYAKFYGTDKDWEADKHHFVFATFQSISSHLQNGKTEKKLFSPNHFSFIVVDESHHAQAETFAEVINYFTPKYKLGMTATPDREDQADIREIFGKEVVNILLPEAIAKGWLTPVDYKLLSDGLDDEKIRAVCKEVLEDNVRLTAKQINEKIFIKVRTREQCKIIEKYSKNKKAIIFCENIEHLQEVGLTLSSSVGLHSKQSAAVNDANYELFESGAVKRVRVVDKFNEGIDIPDTELLAFLRGTDSERIFLQQLGRGLRKVPGKEKVIVLDFVGNIERIKQVSKLAREIDRIADVEREKNGTQKLGNPLHIEGKGFSFDFSDQTVNLLSVFEKLEQDFYSTWQEASKVVIELGIKTVNEYKARHKEDIRLYNFPYAAYQDFPGWYVFLGKEIKTIYETWEEASLATIKLGIESIIEYRTRYKEDKFLPSNPAVTYKDFPGFVKFFGNDFYSTWQEASKSVINLKIKTYSEYKLRYREDSKLPAAPNKYYKDFPGFPMFLRGESKDFYRTWQEASMVCISLDIKGKEDYIKKRNVDSKLPSSPSSKYSDFPGWLTFLNLKIYETWQEAAISAKKFGIKSKVNFHSEYLKRYKEDPRLPSTPYKYYNDFPGWPKFLDLDSYYETWQEAALSARQLGIIKGKGIRLSDEYTNRYKVDDRLPGSPRTFYKDFPGWGVFLNQE